jgi:cob(I)alamin adenosyltransferase
MRLTKIYTKIGDKGTTQLATGTKVAKSAPRIEAYGTIDELNAFVGNLRDLVLAETAHSLKDMAQLLGTIQNELFDLGAELSLPEFEKLGIKLHVISAAEIDRLEREIDGFNEILPPLINFVLPGGHPIVSAAHMARTVCRRSERRVVQLHTTEELRPEVLQYINRLSDWFFVLSRALASRLSVPEHIWQQRK